MFSCTSYNNISNAIKTIYYLIIINLNMGAKNCLRPLCNKKIIPIITYFVKQNRQNVLNADYQCECWDWTSRRVAKCTAARLVS